MNSIISLYSNLTWRRVFCVFFGSSLIVLFLANFYIRGQMEEAKFILWTISFGLVGVITLVFKLSIFITMIIQRYKILNDPKYKELIAHQIAITNHKENDSPVDMIIENLFYIVKKIHPLSKPGRVRINKSIDVLTIDGINFELNKLINSKDQKNIERRVEIELLMNKTIKIETLEKLLNKKISEEWEKQISESINKEDK